MGTQKETYIIHLRCTNCMHIWEESIPKGMQFFSKGFQRSTGYGKTHGKTKVNCPNCGCNTCRSENWEEVEKRIQKGIE